MTTEAQRDLENLAGEYGWVVVTGDRLTKFKRNDAEILVQWTRIGTVYNATIRFPDKIVGWNFDSIKGGIPAIADEVRRFGAK
jgi:hypothetical protein